MAKQHTMEITDKHLEELARIKEKSEDDYEKNITYIAAGTLVLSLTFLEKVVNLKESDAVWFLILSWVLLSITLLGNLVSHQLSGMYHEHCRLLYASNARDTTVADAKVTKYNAIISKLNWAATGTLFLGIFLLVIFCSINAYHKTHLKNSLNDTTMSKQIKPYQPDTQKGRTISQPLKPVKQPATQSDSGQSSQQSNKSK